MTGTSPKVFHIPAAGKCYFEKRTWRGIPARPVLVEPLMAKKRAKKKTFSAVKAVKANARERVGQPKPERIILPVPREQKRGRKHPKTLQEIMSQED